MTSPRTLLTLPVILLSTGCVERTISITSEPPGALVWLNDREVGRTPIEVDFLYYGIYDVRITKDGYEPLLTTGEARPPWWDNVPLDLIAEMVPGQTEARFDWHYVLESRSDDREALLERAARLRRAADDDPGSQ